MTLIPCTTAIALHNNSSSATAAGPRTNVTPPERAAILECRSIVLQSRVKLNLFHISFLSSKGIRNFAIIITLYPITEFPYFLDSGSIYFFCCYVLAVHMVMNLSAKCHQRDKSEKRRWRIKRIFAKSAIYQDQIFLYHAIFIFESIGFVFNLLINLGSIACYANQKTNS